MPEPSEASARLRALYESYLDEAETVEKNRKLGAGWFGMKGGPADDPCHDRFAVDLREYFTELSGSGAPSEVVRDEIAFVFTAPLRYREPRAAYWMLIAVQSLTQELIGLLTPSDAGELAALYEKSFRRHERMPSQIKLIRALKAAAGQ